MNVLLLPQLYSASNLFGVSMVNYLYDLVSVVNAVRDDVHWWFGVPETAEVVRWSAEDFAGLDRVTVFPVLPNGGANRSTVRDGFAGVDYPFYSRECLRLFADLPRYLQFDVVLSNFYTAQQVPALQASYPPAYHYLLPKVGQPTIVNLLTETWLDKSLSQLCAQEGRQAVVFSAAASDVNLVLTRADADELVSEARKFLAPSLVRTLRPLVQRPVLDSEKVPVFKRPLERRTFFHGGTLEAKRHVRELVEHVGRLAAVCDTRLLNTTQLQTAPAWTEGRAAYLEMRTGCNRLHYLQALAEGDFCLCMVDYEGTGLGYTEATLSGMTPVWLRRPWNAGRLPDDYPFFCRGKTEMLQAMHFCATSPLRAKELGQQAVEYVRRLYDKDAQGREWSDLLDQAVETRACKTRALAGGHFMTALVRDGLATLPERFTTGELLAAVAAQSEKLTVQKLAMQGAQVRALAMSLGARPLTGGLDAAGGWLRSGGSTDG